MKFEARQVHWHWVGGEDATQVLHQLTTQDCRQAKPGESVLAAWVDRQGRCKDLWRLVRGEASWWAWGEPEPGPEMGAWVEAHVVSEEVEVRSEPAWLLSWPSEVAPSFPEASALGSPSLEAPPGAWSWQDPDGWHALLPRPVGAAAPEVGGLGWGSPLGPQEAERRRILAGVPAWANELQGKNPWAVRLDAAISLHKGCYLGQEIVARLHHYGKVSEALVGLRGQGLPPLEGQTWTRGGRVVGRLSSVTTLGPEAWAGLAFWATTDGGEGLEWGGQALRVEERPWWSGAAPGSSRGHGLGVPQG